MLLFLQEYSENFCRMVRHNMVDNLINIYIKSNTLKNKKKTEILVSTKIF